MLVGVRKRWAVAVRERVHFAAAASRRAASDGFALSGRSDSLSPTRTPFPSPADVEISARTAALPAAPSIPSQPAAWRLLRTPAASGPALLPGPAAKVPEPQALAKRTTARQKTQKSEDPAKKELSVVKPPLITSLPTD